MPNLRLPGIHENHKYEQETARLTMQHHIWASDAGGVGGRGGSPLNPDCMRNGKHFHLETSFLLLLPRFRWSGQWAQSTKTLSNNNRKHLRIFSEEHQQIYNKTPKCFQHDVKSGPETLQEGSLDNETETDTKYCDSWSSWKSKTEAKQIPKSIKTNS